MPGVSKTIIVEQDRETDVTELSMRWGRMRYAYARSWESRMANERGQDSLMMHVNERYACFSQCDGVGMSFMGDLAARFLGQQILLDLPNLVRGKTSAAEVETALNRHLSGLTHQAKKLVHDHPLPADLPPLVRSVLEEKRAGGSESMFVCGLLNFQQRSITLAWMGDSRLRLWRHASEVTAACLGNLAVNTSERWSSRVGLVGRTHAWHGPLSSLTRLVIYSDGLAAFDRQLGQPVDMLSLKNFIHATGETPNSDDISFLELDFS